MFVIVLLIGAVVKIKASTVVAPRVQKIVMTNVTAVIGGKERGDDRFPATALAMSQRICLIASLL